MNFVLNLFIFWIVIAPVCTILHELGHAAAALIGQRGEVWAWIGEKQRCRWFGFGRLNIGLTLFTFFVGHYQLEKTVSSKWAYTAIAAAGPITSLAIALVLWWIDRTNGSQFWDRLLLLGGVGAFIQFVSTAIPIRYNRFFPGYQGMDSDGMRILKKWRASA